jgi:hypothetical protein
VQTVWAFSFIAHGQWALGDKTMTIKRRSQLLRLLRRLRQQEPSGQQQRLIYRINVRLFRHQIDVLNSELWLRVMAL